MNILNNREEFSIINKLFKKAKKDKNVNLAEKLWRRCLKNLDRDDLKNKIGNFIDEINFREDFKKAKKERDLELAKKMYFGTTGIYGSIIENEIANLLNELIDEKFQEAKKEINIDLCKKLLDIIKHQYSSRNKSGLESTIKNCINETKFREDIEKARKERDLKLAKKIHNEIIETDLFMEEVETLIDELLNEKFQELQLKKDLNTIIEFFKEFIFSRPVFYKWEKFINEHILIKERFVFYNKILKINLEKAKKNKNIKLANLIYSSCVSGSDIEYESKTLMLELNFRENIEKARKEMDLDLAKKIFEEIKCDDTKIKKEVKYLIKEIKFISLAKENGIKITKTKDV